MRPSRSPIMLVVTLLLVAPSFAQTGGASRDPAKLLADPASLADTMSLSVAPSKTATIYRAAEGGWQFNLHSYITHFDGLFWAIWSSGKVDEDAAGQVVRYATSMDGLRWSEDSVLTGPPQTAEGAGKCIARGVFVHEGRLTALVAWMSAKGWSDLRLMRFVWENGRWENKGVFLDNCMNNYPPRPIHGRLFMTRRPVERGVHTALADDLAGTRWTIEPLPMGPGITELSEPSWYVDPDGVVHMLLRVQSPRAKVLARSVSHDHGVTWSPAVLTDYPDATSKNFTGRLSNGWYYLINNANPRGRDPLVISFSRDGWTFSHPIALRKDAGPLRYQGAYKGSGTFQYPHALEHNGALWVIYATNKEDIEISRYAINDLVPPDPKLSPDSTRMLSLANMPYRVHTPAEEAPMEVKPDPAAIDWRSLPQLDADHAVITQGTPQWRFRLHSYLAFHAGKYWAIWSHGPRVEDHPTQHVRYATSPDGLAWSEAKIVTGPSEREGFRYIARGLWVRDGELIALASHDEAYRNGQVHFFGPSLELRAWRWNASSETWEDAGVVFDNAINNFPPKQLASGEWMMSRRSHDRNVSMLVGGVKSLADWRVVPISDYATPDGGRLEEPYWWQLEGGALVGVFRDNSGSKRLLRSFSADEGRTWTAPVRTDFPDATSKFNAVQTSRGYLAMVSNPNPAGRNPLCLSVSEDGLVFIGMGVLPVPGDGTFQYPQVIEHDGALLVIFSRNKTAIEVVKVSLDEVDRLRHEPRP